MKTMGWNILTGKSQMCFGKYSEYYVKCGYESVCNGFGFV